MLLLYDQGGSKVKSSFELNYIPINLDNIGLAYKIQKETWPDDPDYDDLYDKATNPLDDNCFFIVYDKSELIGITGVDVFRQYPEDIWLDWFTVLPKYRRKGYGEKILLDTINYCKSLNRYKNFRIEVTYQENRPALFLYDNVMEIKEDYTAEDTEDYKTQTLIYTYHLNGNLELWDNKYLGLREYYKSME